MNRFNLAFNTILTAATLLFFSCQNDPLIYENDDFQVYSNKVVQGDFTARAISPHSIETDYIVGSEHPYISTIRFKFSINSRDNEFKGQEEHILTLMPKDGHYEMNAVPFGVPTKQVNADSLKPLPPNTKWTVRVNMTQFQESIKIHGYYVTPTGDSIFAEDFKGVYVAGNSLPLTWDFENLYSKPQQQLQPIDGSGIYETTLTMNPQTPNHSNRNGWTLEADISQFPTYTSDQLLIDALYNMSLEELLSNIRSDETFKAGEAWDGVWTRDVSYSIYLALAYMAPEEAKKSLEAKVKNGRIIQDTGTGGAWPVSSDRVVWATAAWELYLYTGDKDWLRYAFDVIRFSAYPDLFVLYDKQTGLMRGEQSYLDWREQSYPKWAQPIDIYNSQCLGTNILFYNQYMILYKMAKLLDFPASDYLSMAESLKEHINQRLWMPKYGYYGQYLYAGVNPIISPSIDALGESLAILFGVADNEQSKKMIESIPVTPFGITSIFPQIEGIKPYHNNAIWPFVQSYWNLAAAKAGNEPAVLHGIGSLYRAAALFATNKELFVASTGDFRGTAVNSDKMLWSLSGNIAMIYRLYFGIQFTEQGCRFSPFVPHTLKGEKKIDRFKYRDGIYTIELVGTGNKIKSFKIDGEEREHPIIPTNMTGKHHIRIELYDNHSDMKGKVNNQSVVNMPATVMTTVDFKNQKLKIDNFDSTMRYNLYVNGKLEKEFRQAEISLPEYNQFIQLQVTATDPQGWMGFSSNPVYFVPSENTIIQSVLPSGQAIMTTPKQNTNISIVVNVPTAGLYGLDFRYSNGSGPINTQNKCAIRSLFNEEEFVGSIVMPQRGENEWGNYGYSNAILLPLKAGKNTLYLKYIEQQDANMNVVINDAMIQQIRLGRITNQ